MLNSQREFPGILQISKLAIFSALNFEVFILVSNVNLDVI